ncbi:MAG: hypothetical protein LBK61_05930, partial [Spirochaetaceae bacterium]|nr:hypothetical protein [Spirochaetaceae bacterium]
MATTQTTETGKQPSAETVWAILAELGAKMDRFAEEAAERKKESAEDFRELKKVLKEVSEEQKKTERSIKATDKQIGKLGGRYGEMVECMVLPNLAHKFRKLG